ncbi:hypothetical protein TWF679_003531 [Orbilia oligospora]|uniref:Uncharacterized protein n=1 Tax=Orbilia oligospora TaxID=2813651 RepID=A0A8H8URB1_ORBOL|nr:hypothetical protein TWF679_003531 [Orbilia oligospora]
MVVKAACFWAQVVPPADASAGESTEEDAEEDFGPANQPEGSPIEVVGIREAPREGGVGTLRKGREGDSTPIPRPGTDTPARPSRPEAERVEEAAPSPVTVEGNLGGLSWVPTELLG